MKNNLLLILFLWMLIAAFSKPALAEDPTAFYLTCDRTKSILVEVASDYETLNSENPRQVIGCQVQLTPEAGKELDKHSLKNWGKMLPICAGEFRLTMHDSKSRSIPPTIFFTGETWEEVRAKVMAICPDKMPDIPQRVLDHQPAN